MLTTFVFTEPNLDLPNEFDLYNFFYDNLHISTREQSRAVDKSALQVLNDYLGVTFLSTIIPVPELYFALSNRIEPEIQSQIKEICKVKDKGLDARYHPIINLINKWLYGDNIFFYFYLNERSFGDSVYNIAVTLPTLAIETPELKLKGVVYSKEV